MRHLGALRGIPPVFWMEFFMSCWYPDRYPMSFLIEVVYIEGTTVWIHHNTILHFHFY